MEQKKNDTYVIWEKTSSKNGSKFLSLKTPDGKWVTLFLNKYATPENRQPMWKEAPPRPDKEDMQTFAPMPEQNDEQVPF